MTRRPCPTWTPPGPASGRTKDWRGLRGGVCLKQRQRTEEGPLGGGRGGSAGRRKRELGLGPLGLGQTQLDCAVTSYSVMGTHGVRLWAGGGGKGLTPGMDGGVGEHRGCACVTPLSPQPPAWPSLGLAPPPHSASTSPMRGKCTLHSRAVALANGNPGPTQSQV